MCNLSPPPSVPKSSEMDISKRNEGGSMKLTALVDYIICTSISSRMHFRVTNVFYYYFFNHFFYS